MIRLNLVKLIIVLMVATSAAAQSELPSYVDNSQLPHFPVVRSQGSLGSCVAFAASYYLLTFEVGAREGWNNKNNDNTTKFSPKFIYNFVNGGGNGGSAFGSPYPIYKKHGNLTWAQFPYDSNYKAWPYNNPEAWREALRYRICDNGPIYVASDEGVEDLKEYLASGHIVNFATYIHSWQYKNISNDPATSADDPFVGKQAAFWLNGSNGGHAMTVVGYNDDIWVDINSNGTVDVGEKGALRIANSWGTGWKEGGFTWLAYDALRGPSAVAGAPSDGRVRAMHSVTKIDVCEEPPPIKLLGEFTVHHPKRYQMSITTGKGATTALVPATTEYGGVLSSNGGAYGFDGVDYSSNPASAPVGTFLFDFTTLQPLYGQMARYFLGFNDTTDPTFVGSIRRFRLMDAFANVLADSGDISLQDATDYSSIVYATINSRLTDLIVDNLSVSVPEGGSASFRVKLASAPQAVTSVTLQRKSGDADISIGGQPQLVFTPENWNQWQQVTLFAAEDQGATIGSAQILLDGGNFGTAIVSAYEVENDAMYMALMDANPGWMFDSQWEWGAPSGQGTNPAVASTGSAVIGYNLAGDYPPNLTATKWATTPAINCASCQNIKLGFQRWLNIEHSVYDHAYVQVSGDNGVTWQQVWQNGATLQDRQWVAQSFDISQIADGKSQVKVRWGIGPTDSSVQYSGWNLDDVVVSGDCDIVTIEATAGVGGTISPIGTLSVPRGSSYSFTISPDSGYSIYDLRVDGVSKGALTAYNLNNVNQNHTIAALFQAEADNLAPAAPDALRVSP